MREGDSRGLDMIPRTKRGNQATEPEGNHAYPVHRPNWLIVAGIVITVVLGRASWREKQAFGKDGLTIVKVGRVRRRTQPERFA
jgi:hypothetical protein